MRNCKREFIQFFPRYALLLPKKRNLQFHIIKGESILAAPELYTKETEAKRDLSENVDSADCSLILCNWQR